jgi:hypothetical protein
MAPATVETGMIDFTPFRLLFLPRRVVVGVKGLAVNALVVELSS